VRRYEISGDKVLEAVINVGIIIIISASGGSNKIRRYSIILSLAKGGRVRLNAEALIKSGRKRRRERLPSTREVQFKTDAQCQKLCGGRSCGGQ